MDIRKLTNILKIFFSKYDALLLGLEELTRDNFERLPAPGNGLLKCYTAHVLFYNKGIFGVKGDYLNEIHPRLLFLNMQLASYLKKQKITVSGPSAKVAIGIFPYINHYGKIGKSLPIYIRNSTVQNIVPSTTLVLQSSYYARLIKKFGACFGVVTNNGTVIGPDGGLIAASCEIAKTYNKKLSVLEFGSGAGSTALALARQDKIRLYLGNDFSPEMVRFFINNVAPVLNSKKINSAVFQGSCFDMPLNKQVDLISVGVYYQAQPSLFAKMGRKIVKCLNKSGVLVIQSGMQEDPFVTNLLTGLINENCFWPWYKNEYHLNTYFQYVSKYIIEQEVVLIATNSYNKFIQITKLFCGKYDFRRLAIS